MSKTPEGAVLKLILDYLAARHVLCFRMNTLAMPTADGKRFIKAGVPGMADILAFPQYKNDWGVMIPHPLWIEVKAAKGKQSDLQKSFEAQVKAQNHWYVVAYGIEDVARWLD